MSNGPPIHWYVRGADGALTSIACGKPAEPGRFTLEHEKVSCRGCITSGPGMRLEEAVRNDMWDVLNERRGTSVLPPWVRERKKQELKEDRAAAKAAKLAEREAKKKARDAARPQPF